MKYLDIQWKNGDIPVDSSGNFQLLKDISVIEQDILARILTVKGSFWCYINDGAGIDSWANRTFDKLSILELQQQVILEVQKHPDVLSATALVTVTDTNKIKIQVNCVLLSYDELTVITTVGNK